MPSDREYLYSQFGPKLLEAICLVLKEQINNLRSIHGLPPFSNAQVLAAIKTELASLPDFDFMADTEPT